MHPAPSERQYRASLRQVQGALWTVDVPMQRTVPWYEELGRQGASLTLSWANLHDHGHDDH